MSKEIYRCEPCNYEYEHLYFDTVRRDMQKAVPPCPSCGKDLTKEEQEVTDEYLYWCWSSEGGCGAEIDFPALKGEAPKTVACPVCGKAARLKVVNFGIVHGNSMAKGASLDVAIGRNAEQRWSKIYDRKANRDKIRRESGTQALSVTDKGIEPLKGARLESVAIPDSTLNKGEKL